MKQKTEDRRQKTEVNHIGHGTWGIGSVSPLIKGAKGLLIHKANHAYTRAAQYNPLNPPLLRGTLKGIVVILLTLLSSCNQFLDEVPDNRVALDNLDKAAQLLTNGYSIASYAFTDWMTDDVSYTQGVNLRTNHQQAFAFEDFTDGPETQDTPAFFWSETYNAIAHANEVLAKLEDLPATTPEAIVRKNAIEAEARLIRAYGHFMLVNLFAQHYDESTADTDLGIPYVDEPETIFIKKYTRNTVQEVYDKVEEDMLKGIALANDSYYQNSGKYHFNRNAALAFASRFYLFKEEYNNCIKYSTMLLGSDAGNFVRDLTGTAFQNVSSSIEGYPQLYSSPDLPSNLMLMRKISLAQRPDFGHGPSSNDFYDLFQQNPFGADDARSAPALQKGLDGAFPLRYQSLFERSSLNSSSGFPYHIAIAFRGEEVLLNRAEAYAARNQLNNAIADLQVLTNKRYSNGPHLLNVLLLRNFYGVPVSEGSRFDQMITFDYVIRERQREFIIQGMRWFDIKRFELELSHQLPNGQLITLAENDLRKALQIPQSAIDVGGLKPNPR